MGGGEMKMLQKPTDKKRNAVGNMILFALQERFGNEHGHIDVFVTELFKLGIHDALNVLPYSVAVRAYYHTPLNARIIGKLRLFYDVGIPLRKINVHRRDLLDHFLVFVSHDDCKILS